MRELVKNTALPVSCKIRLLDGPVENTIDFMKRLVDSGASAITLHLRYTDDRPRIPCHKECFSPVLQAMNEYAPAVPICYNGDIFSFDDVCSLRKKYPKVGLMIGRGAILDMGVFNGTTTTYDDTNREFIRLSAQFNNCFANVKYTVYRIITEGKHQFEERSEQVHNSHDWETLGDAYGVGGECVQILEKLREQGLETDGNLRKEDGGKHRKSKKRANSTPSSEKESDKISLQGTSS